MSTICTRSLRPRISTRQHRHLRPESCQQRCSTSCSFLESIQIHYERNLNTYFWNAWNISSAIEFFEDDVTENISEVLRQVLTLTPSWWNLDLYTPSVPCYTPTCVLYYGGRMLNQLPSVEGQFWIRGLQLEFSALYNATSFHEGTGRLTSFFQLSQHLRSTTRGYSHRRRHFIWPQSPHNSWLRSSEDYRCGCGRRCIPLGCKSCTVVQLSTLWLLIYVDKPQRGVSKLERQRRPTIHTKNDKRRTIWTSVQRNYYCERLQINWCRIQAQPDLSNGGWKIGDEIGRRMDEWMNTRRAKTSMMIATTDHLLISSRRIMMLSTIDLRQISGRLVLLIATSAVKIRTAEHILLRDIRIIIMRGSDPHYRNNT